MTSPRERWARAYGASGWHLALMVLSLTVAAYVLATLGWSALWNPESWWQSIAVWFVGAVLLHDLVLFPVYALVDRGLRTLDARRARPRSPVPVLNYLRMPTMVAAFTFVMFFPGIVQQGADKFRSASGLTQDPFLERWLLLVAASYLLSALLYGAAVARQRIAARAERPTVSP